MMRYSGSIPFAVVDEVPSSLIIACACAVLSSSCLYIGSINLGYAIRSAEEYANHRTLC